MRSDHRERFLFQHLFYSLHSHDVAFICIFHCHCTLHLQLKNARLARIFGYCLHYIALFQDFHLKDLGGHVLCKRKTSTV